MDAVPRVEEPEGVVLAESGSAGRLI